MKKWISFLIIIVIVISALSACNTSDNLSDAKLSIVATIFPEYDWVLQILGDQAKNADVELLLDKGVDLHSYQPSAEDIIKVSSCDLFIYVGGESDEWAEDILNTAKNDDLKVINLLDVLGDNAKIEETVEGMESEEEEEYDEHVWLSLRNAVIFCNAIRDSMSEIDPENKDVYSSNCTAYLEKLDDLDKEYEKAISSASVRTLLFADRFPFRYLTDDYGLTYYAAFSGCSAESEASFETVAFLAGKIDELGLKNVITLEGSDNKIAQTLISSAKTDDILILSLDSMQSKTAADLKNGVTYLSVMEKNLEVLRDALN